MIYKDKKGDLEQEGIKEELSKFINLLQADSKSQEKVHNRVDQTLSKKLSIIMSASEPESSVIDKDVFTPSANRSYDSSQKENYHYTLVKSLIDSGLNASQQGIANKLKQCIDDFLRLIDKSERRFERLQLDLLQQKKENNQLMEILMKLNIQQKQLWNNYSKTLEINKLMEKDILALEERLISLQNDNEFMKKLILHANENYEVLQKKCQQLQRLRQRTQLNTDRKQGKKSSIDNLLKSVKTKKNSHSPSHSEVTLSPKKKQFQEIYRKMIVRTLKFKGKQLLR